MAIKIIIKTAKFVAKIFYVFLDISGILLGLFLISIGYWIITGHSLSKASGYIVLILGSCAFLIHLGHYFSLKLTRWIFGDSDYFKTRK